MRPGVTSMMLALPCAPSVMTPAWLPVNERGAVAEVGDRHGDQRHRDPLAGGQEHVHLARRRQRADLAGRGRAARRWCRPWRRRRRRRRCRPSCVSAIRRATRLMLSASASDEPPYFWTTMGTCDSRDGGAWGSRHSNRPSTDRTDARMPGTRHPLTHCPPAVCPSGVASRRYPLKAEHPMSIVIIGAGLAGGTAADRAAGAGLRRDGRPRRGRGHPPYERPPLSKGYLLGNDAARRRLRAPARLVRRARRRPAARRRGDGARHRRPRR